MTETLAPAGRAVLDFGFRLFVPVSDFEFRISDLVFFLLLSTLASSVALASSGSWHIPEAVLRFTIEADPNHLQTPNVDVRGRKMNAIDWSGGYYRIDGKLYKHAIGMISPGSATYRCPEGVRQFVALVGVRQDAAESASIVFEVFADARRLFRSRPMTRHMPPVGINVRVPRRTKELRLVVTGDSQGHHWAGWINAGFWTKVNDARVGHVTLPVPGFDPSQYEAVVFTGNDKRVAGARLGMPLEGQVDHLFFAGHGWPTYYVYWVPKDKYEPESQEWQPNAGLILETRRVDKSRRRECEDLAGLMKAWSETDQILGRSLAGGIHHGYPVHPCPANPEDGAAKGDLALYRYTGFFEADQAGEYLFATASHWGSYLLVNDKPVVSWPGEHNYRDGIKGEKQGKVNLTAGIHKLDYFNYSPWGTMVTLAAWQPPGGKFGVMTGSDFPALRRYAVTGVELNPAADKRVCFTWSVVDDWRLDRDKMAMIRMRFQVVPDRAESGRRVSDEEPQDEDAPQSPTTAARGPASGDYRWVFDDGVARTGQTVERVFLRPAKHRVAVQWLQGGQAAAETAQVVRAGTLAEKIWVDPRDPNAFRREISRIDFRRAPIADVVHLHTFGVEMPEPAWRDTAVQVLLNRTDELVGRPEYHPLCLELARHLSSAPVQQYDRAMDLYTRLQEKTAAGAPLRQQTMVLAGELLLRCLGKPEAALRLLNQARWEKAQDRTWTIRHGLARAEALLALGQNDELEEQMRQLVQIQGQQDAQRQELRHAGLLRRAQSLARGAKNKDSHSDPTELDATVNDVQAILCEDPMQILSPGLNTIRLDLHLARGEYRMASYLAERLAKLDLSPYDRAQVLVRHVNALCELGDLDGAKEILAELTRTYPDSEPTAQARAMLIAAGKAQ